MRIRNPGYKDSFLGPFLPSRCRIHERTISLRFLGIILRVLRLEVSVYITNQFITTFAQDGRGSKIRLVEVTVNINEETC
jgi:hypothetical protein